MMAAMVKSDPKKAKRRGDPAADRLAKIRREIDADLSTALANVATGADPRIDTDHYAVRIVDNPYFDPGNPGATPRRYKAVVAQRDDPVGRMARRRQLGGPEETDTRLKAAREYQAISERAEIGGAKAIDPGKEVVDGGRFAEPDTDTRLRAQAKLVAAHAKLGKVGEMLVRRVLAEKWEIQQVAAQFGASTRRSRSSIGDRFVECLDTLAEHFGIFATAPAARPLRDMHSRMARYGDNPELHRAIHRASRQR